MWTLTTSSSSQSPGAYGAAPAPPALEGAARVEQPPQVIDDLECPQAAVDRRAAEEVTREERDHRGLHLQLVAGTHEQALDTRRGHAVDEPGEIAHAAAHAPLEAAQRRGRFRRVTQEGIDRLDAAESAVHAEQHAGREHRIDERPGVADENPALAVHSLGEIGVVAGGGHVAGQLRLRQALRERRTARDGVEEELTRIALAQLHVFGIAHRADARLAVEQRDEPEPAM